LLVDRLGVYRRLTPCSFGFSPPSNHPPPPNFVLALFPCVARFSRRPFRWGPPDFHPEFARLSSPLDFYGFAHLGVITFLDQVFETLCFSTLFFFFVVLKMFLGFVVSCGFLLFFSLSFRGLLTLGYLDLLRPFFVSVFFHTLQVGLTLRSPPPPKPPKNSLLRFATPLELFPPTSHRLGFLAVLRSKMPLVRVVFFGPPQSYPSS